MNTLSKLGLALAALPALGAAAHAQGTECGDVQIAEMNWASAGVLAQLDMLILEEGYGCEVELVTGDTLPTFASMTERGEPDVAPEVWVNSMREQLDEQVEAGTLVLAASSLSDGAVEGWWIPKYIADANPDIKTVSDALARPDLFPSPEDPSVGGVYTCPSGWTCEVITENLFRAHDAGSKGFELVDPGSAAGLDGSIANAFSQQKGWLGYYWAPTSVLGKYEMVALDMEADHDPEAWADCTLVPDCENPQPNDWVRADVFTVVTDELAAENPVAMDYLSKRAWSNDTVNGLLAWQADEKASNEDTAYHFLETGEEVWTQWVSPEAAEAIRNAL